MPHSDVSLTKGSDPKPTEAQEYSSNSEAQRSKTSLKWEKGYHLVPQKEKAIWGFWPIDSGSSHAFSQKESNV